MNADCQLGRGDKTCSTESCESIGDDANGVTPVVTHSMPVVAKCPGSGRLSAVCTAEMGDELVAVDLGPGRTALQISAGEKHTCAVLVSGPSEILSLSLSLSLPLSLSLSLSAREVLPRSPYETCCIKLRLRSKMFFSVYFLRRTTNRSSAGVSGARGVSVWGTPRDAAALVFTSLSQLFSLNLGRGKPPYDWL